LTPTEERAVLDSLAAGVEESARDAYQELLRLIRDGVSPREAVAQVIESLQQDVAAALSAALSSTIGTAAMTVDGPIVRVELSRRLYAQAEQTSATVATIVQRHAQGLNDARSLALQLFEGYGFREAGAEPLRINPRNDELPQYLRDLLRASPGVERDLSRAFARIQVNNLTTPALRAAYSGVLEAIDAVEAGKAKTVLENRLRVAFFERMRYFSNRVAQTELHRAYMRQEARRLMEDDDVEFVQIRRAPGRQTPCICALYTGRDRYGLGPGVYPKARAPRPPMHPFCRCVISPRLDLTGMKAGEEDPQADVYFLRRLGEPVAARVVGSQGKLDAVLRGASADEIHNAAIPGPYKVRAIGEPG
jgi:hypothetical protein